MKLFDYFPKGYAPRDGQTELLESIETALRVSDVICVTAPTAIGKTVLSLTIANYMAAQGKSTSYLVPTNVLLTQLSQEFPDLAVLKKKDLYSSLEHYKEAKEHAQESRVRAMNYHMYMALKMYSHCMIGDEGHKVVDMLADMGSVKIWSSEYKFPTELMTVGDVLAWIESEPNWRNDRKLSSAYRSITSIKHNALVEYNNETYYGKRQPVLSVVPMSTKSLPPILWPSVVKKIVLLSATINPKDIDELGLSLRRVTYIEADSPIDPMRRQVKYIPAGRMSNQTLIAGAKRISEKINELADLQTNDKGIIHIPYGAANELRKHLIGPRYIWHTHDDKDSVLNRFKTSKEPLVMIASGMYEGVDLPYDKARWQVIAKVPFLNLGSPKVKAKMEKDSDWYAWEAIKRIVQATGRIVRAPDDFGVTYILDNSFAGLWYRDSERKNDRMFPKYFRESLILK